MLNLILGFGALGMPEWLMILAAVLLLFGGKKIPELMKGIGKGIREFNSAKNNVRKEVEEEQNKRLNTIKSNRNNQDVEASLLKIQECCKSGENLMPSIIKAVESYATLGEIVDSMKEVFGEWQEKVFF